ncbi:VirE N-terminal domain protein [Phocaeicola dorei 5_1_36/D4]|uniref:VapE domain-containing protein n=1 Tax=Phocaeicola dorei TaxID=357276 RepID=UPI0001A26F46|nr:VapE domain-containing protein [Phocaeicola dorei]EEO46352.1 VirE N-terminal domain protein [Phocaeicola dorei 5_1_36/D4]
MNKDFFKSSNPSRFHSLRDTRPEPTTWQVLFKEITNSTHTTATRHYRAHLATLSDIEATGDAQQLEQWKLTKSNLKNAQPAFIPSVLLEGGRTYAHVKGFTGFIMVDIDGIPPERFAAILTLVKEDIHSFLVYITISGCGIRVISHVEGGVTKANYRMVWEWVNDHYARLCGVEIDGQCKNATRMSVLCHDPEALLRPEASSFHTSGMKPREKPKRGTAVTVTAERAYKIIRAQLEEEGIAYAPGSYNDYVSRCFYHTNRCGVPQADAEAWALRTFPDYPREQLLPIIKSCYSLTMEFNTVPLPRSVRKKEKENDSSHKKATVEEMEEFINSYMKFRMNMLTHQIETQLIADAYTDRPEASACHWQRLTDHIENSLWCAMQHHGMAVNLNELHTLLGSDFVKEYHPLKEYLDGLPPWDGETDYIDRLAAMVHVKESPHSPLQQDKSRERNDLSETPVRFADILKRWMVSMIAAALNETVVNQVILTLIGRQGSYKTSFMQHILPPVLSEYYTTKSNSSRMTKDDLFTMTENLVINLEEIDTMPPSELNQLKAMVTQRYVDERRAYGRNKVHLPHVASFVATGNNLQFLTDDTGNRRWLPFEVEDIDSPWEADIPYEGIYSQTYALYQDVNFRYWFTDKEIQQLRGHVQQFEVPRPEYELILTYYRKPVGLERGVYTTSSQIIGRFGNTSLRLSLQKVGRAMRELGFRQVKASNANYWVVVERTTEEVQHLLPAETEQADPPGEKPSEENTELPF